MFIINDLNIENKKLNKKFKSTTIIWNFEHSKKKKKKTDFHVTLKTHFFQIYKPSLFTVEKVKKIFISYLNFTFLICLNNFVDCFCLEKKNMTSLKITLLLGSARVGRFS